MKTYSFTCTSCKDVIESPFYLEGHASEWGHTEEGDPEDFTDSNAVGVCGPLKRNWSGSFVWAYSERGH